nr:MAG TPA: Single strand binding protein [Caudoviricetes sp.]
MLNKIILQGRLVRDPEMRTTQSGKSIASFTLAVERDFAPQGQKKETDFINCTAWNGTADFISRYFSKGSMATVCGSLQIQNYTDRDGNKRSAPNVNVENIYFAGEKRAEKSKDGEKSKSVAKGKGAYSSKATPKQTFEEMEDGSDDELPF